MVAIQDIFAGYRPRARKGRKRPTPLVHSLRAAGTKFPIVSGRFESEAWFSTSPPSHFKSSLSAGIASVIGGRGNNEDTALVFFSQIEDKKRSVPVCFAVVADGMGGHWGGELASSIVAETLAAAMIDMLFEGSAIRCPENQDDNSIFDALDRAMQSAHELVQTQLLGGGTTATCALVIDSAAFIAHVGDCRAYVFSGQRMEQVTRDHSVAAALKERGGDTEPAVMPNRSMLYRAVGVEGPLDVDHYLTLLDSGSTLLICSDGVWDELDEAEITRIVDSSGTPQSACEQLMLSSLDAGTSDNATAVMIRRSQ